MFCKIQHHQGDLCFVNVPGAQHEFGAVVRNLSDAGCGLPVSTRADSTAGWSSASFGCFWIRTARDSERTLKVNYPGAEKWPYNKPPWTFDLLFLGLFFWGGNMVTLTAASSHRCFSERPCLDLTNEIFSFSRGTCQTKATEFRSLIPIPF